MREVCMHIVNNTSAMIMERFDTIMFVSVLYITKSHHWTVRIAACLALRLLLTMEPQQVVPGETEAADGLV